jgi:hypothetical protein
MSNTLKILSPNPRRKAVYPISVHDINDEITPLKRRRKHHHHRNPYNNFYKEQPNFKPLRFRKALDGFLLMDTTKVETPYEAVYANLQGRQLGHVI